jgi:hypothetical protein
MTMETFIQPKITGYRQLNEAEVAQMNIIKALGEEISTCVQEMLEHPNFDQRAIRIGITELQTGLMWLTRAVARPESF